jgi:hypothetical protein
VTSSRSNAISRSPTRMGMRSPSNLIIT